MLGEFRRGSVYLADLGAPEPKYWVVVSNNRRNKGLESVLAVRVTTTDRHRDLPTCIELPHGECLHGFVLCDSLTEMFEEDVVKRHGGFSPAAMAAIGKGLKAALDLD